MRYKKIVITIVFMILMTLMTACTREYKSIEKVDYKNNHYVIDKKNNSITCDGVTYEYTINKGETTITYPNGETFWMSQRGNTSISGWSDNYDPSHYIEGGTLIELLDRYGDSGFVNINIRKILLGLVFIVIGIIAICSPQTAWYFSIGWKFKKAEPSDIALLMERIGGVLVVLFGIFIMFQ